MGRKESNQTKPVVIKTFVLLIFEWPFYTVFTVYYLFGRGVSQYIACYANKCFCWSCRCHIIYTRDFVSWCTPFITTTMFHQIRVYVLINIHRVLLGVFTLNELISSQFLDVVSFILSVYHRDKECAP